MRPNLCSPGTNYKIFKVKLIFFIVVKTQNKKVGRNILYIIIVKNISLDCMFVSFHFLLFTYSYKNVIIHFISFIHTILHISSLLVGTIFTFYKNKLFLRLKYC